MEQSIIDILINVISNYIVVILSLIIIFFRKSLKKLWGSSLVLFNRIKKNWLYKRTIRLIRKKKTSVTDEFLFGKSPEKNPDMLDIFQMMDSGEIEAPPQYKESQQRKRLFEKLKEMDIKINLDSIKIKPNIIVKPPEIPKDWRR